MLKELKNIKSKYESCIYIYIFVYNYNFELIYNLILTNIFINIEKKIAKKYIYV